MVRSRRAAATRARLIEAAGHEFAARGFDGAKVDRIAARARVNKAMLYYHFDSKAALYREILRDLFGAVGGSVAAVRQAGGPPADQIRRFIEAVAREALARPHFPAIWLREVAEGGRHLDASIVREMRRVVDTLAEILADGRASGAFADAHPLITQVTIVAPLLFFVASTALRERVSHLVPVTFQAAGLDAMVTHVQRVTLAMLTPPPAARLTSPKGRS
jgi:TetR/AcrR family transcriptional regulator